MMRIRGGDLLRKCVVYVGIESGGSFVPLGTGTLLGLEYDADRAVFFLLTAKHVTDQISGNAFVVRINQLSGQAVSLAMAKDKMFAHDDPNTDLALFPISLDEGVHDFRVIPLDRPALERNRAEFYGFEVGDEVVATGLYTSHYGTSKNIPVTRIGNLAMLLEEPVRGPGGYVDAYLIELRTIAGLSGSPVFINPPDVIAQDGKIKYAKGFNVLPLGILVGYHVVESKEDQVQVPRLQPPDVRPAGSEGGDSVDERNTGFGVVIPFERVLDIAEMIREKIVAAAPR